MTDKANKKPIKKPTGKKTVVKPKISAKEKAMAKSIAELEEQVEKLESELDDQNERVEAAEEKMLRVVAEYENGKKRVEREKERSLSFAKDRILSGLFPIIDNLQRSEKYEKEHGDENSKQHGVTLVLEQLRKYLKDVNNVESFESLGEVFDPDLHEAMAMQPSDDHKPGIVIEVFEEGYKTGDRVLRAAKVVVSQ